jgi:hypothetical protein
MMKKLTVLFLLFSSVVIAQDVKTSKEFLIDVGTPYLVIDAPVKRYFSFEDKVMSIKVRGADIKVQLFDANTLNQKEFTFMDKSQLPAGFTHEEFLQRGASVFQFYNVWDKPNKTEQIFCQEFNFNNFGKPTNQKLLFTSDKLKSQMGGTNKIDLYQSFDKSKMLLVYEVKSNEKKDALNFQTFGMYVFDENFKELWHKEIKMPYSEKEIQKMGYTLDNNGVAYLLLRKKLEDEDTPLEILKIDNGAEPKNIKIEANGKRFPRGVRLQEGKDGNIYLGGFYAVKDRAQGAYLSILNSKGEIENEKYHEFSIDLINQNISERAQSKNEKKEEAGDVIGIKGLNIDQIKIYNDGSIGLIGEVYYVSTIAIGLSDASNNFELREMMMVKLDERGNLLWMSKLVKNQTYKKSYSGSYGTALVQARVEAGLFERSKMPIFDLSYKYLNSGDNHYFIYLDNVKNLDLPLNKYPAPHTSRLGGYLTAYKVDDKTGEISKLSLFDLRNLKGQPVAQFDVERMVQRSDEEIFVELYKKKKEDVLIRIKITE